MTLLDIWKRNGSGFNTSNYHEETTSTNNVSRNDSNCTSTSVNNSSNKTFIERFKERSAFKSQQKLKSINLHSDCVKQHYLVLKDDPHRFYQPSQNLNGELILELKYDIPNIILQLNLNGSIKVKVTNSTGTGLKTLKPVEFLNKSIILYGNPETSNIDNGCDSIGLSKGLHKIPFRLQLPSNRKLYNEIKFERGSVEYYLQSNLKVSGSDSVLSFCKVPLHIFASLDVSPYLNKPRNKTVILKSSTISSSSHSSTHKIKSHISSSNTSLITTINNNNNNGNDNSSTNYSVNNVNSGRSISSSNVSNYSGVSDGCGSHDKDRISTGNDTLNPQMSKTVKLSVSIPHSGYILGESIPININIQHYKNYFHSSGIIITLVRICRIGSIKDMNTETFRKDCCQTVSPLTLDESTNFQFNKIIPITVPLDIFATFNTKAKHEGLFHFNYYIEVLVDLSNKVRINFNNPNNGNSSNISNINSNIPNVVNSYDDNGNNNVVDSNKLNSGFLLPTVTSEDQTKFNEDEMINVEALKRHRDVTGMSIEIVIGNIKKLHPPYLSIQTEQALAFETLPNYTPSNDINKQNLLNESIRLNEDKQDLQRQQLKQLESEPPEFY